MKHRFSKLIKAFLTVLLTLFSCSVIANIHSFKDKIDSVSNVFPLWGLGGLDTLRHDTTYFLIPRQALDFYNVQSVKYDSLQKENIRLYYINNLYKQSLSASVKVDNLQEDRFVSSSKVIKLLDGNYKQMRKRVLKIRFQNIFSDIKEPLFLVGGFVLGFVVHSLF